MHVSVWYNICASVAPQHSLELVGVLPFAVGVYRDRLLESLSESCLPFLHERPECWLLAPVSVYGRAVCCEVQRSTLQPTTVSSGRSSQRILSLIHQRALAVHAYWLSACTASQT